MDQDWGERLADMEEWYRDLLRSGRGDAEQSLLNDYRPYTTTLARLSGRILDVGGGAGLAARFLDPESDYWIIDPAAVWQEPVWDEFATGFRNLGPTPSFVIGGGEELPFDTASFDAVLAFWSL